MLKSITVLPPLYRSPRAVYHLNCCCVVEERCRLASPILRRQVSEPTGTELPTGPDVVGGVRVLLAGHFGERFALLP